MTEAEREELAEAWRQRDLAEIKRADTERMYEQENAGLRALLREAVASIECSDDLVKRIEAWLS